MVPTQSLPPSLLGAQAELEVYPEQSVARMKRGVMGPLVTCQVAPPLRGSFPVDNGILVNCPGVAGERVHAALRCLQQPTYTMSNSFPVPPPIPETAEVQHMRFATGDPYTLLVGAFSGRQAVVAHDFTVDDSQTLGDHLFIFLQAIQTCREAGAQRHIVTLLPQWMDSQVFATPFNRLALRLARSAGAREVHFRSELGTGSYGQTPAELRQQVLRRLHKTAIPHEKHAVLQLCASYAEQSSVRGLDAEAASWNDVAVQAALQIMPLQRNSCGPPVVLGVQTATELTDRLTDALAAQNAEHWHHRLDVEHGEVEFDGCTLAGRDVIIVQNTRGAPQQAKISAATMALEGLLLLQAARDQGARTVSIVLAYQMNSRSDRPEFEQSKSRHVAAYGPGLADLYKSFKPERVIFVESHDLHTPQAWSSPTWGDVRNLGGMEILIDHVLPGREAKKEAVLALPDDGAKKRAQDISRAFGRVVICQKARPNHRADPQVELFDTRLSPTQTVVLPDDEVGTGSTLAQSLKLLKSHGAGDVHAVICHNNLPQCSIERAKILAFLRYSGAKSLRFLDTQPMGPLANSWAEVMGLGGQPADIAAFFAKHDIHISANDFFANLQDFVQVVSIAPYLAETLEPLFSPKKADASTPRTRRPLQLLRRAQSA